MKTSLLLLAIPLIACAPKLGPDKQFVGTLQGGATGAVSGAVTGFQVGASTGPGAVVGAGVGALAGGFRGAAHDRLEEELLRLQADVAEARGSSFAQRVLQEQWVKRQNVHPGRDIFPSDIFFNDDDVVLSPEGKAVLKEIYRLNRGRLAWSRMGILAYIQAAENTSSYAQFLSRRRGKAIGDYFVSLGFEPRRISARALVLPAPIVLDPHDRGDRYSQAIEFVPRDLPNAPGEKLLRPAESEDGDSASLLETPS